MSDIAKYALTIAHDIAVDIAFTSASNTLTDELNSLSNSNLKEPFTNTSIDNHPLYQALLDKSVTLANSYAQVKQDIGDESRLSWAGTAHEIREILRTLLRTLAPDSDVKVQTWYQQENNTTGPTQKQRVRYILESRGAGSKEREAAEQVEKFEEMVGDLVRATYSRASVAAHQYRARNEVIRILRYFEAFAHDLLSID